MKPLQPLRSNKVWGYEDWIASTHKDGPQKDFIELTQNYPLLVKIIQADDTLSVQVHPDDQTASLLEGKNERGKTECWYVLDAEEGSALVYGLKKDYTAEEITQALKNNTVEGYLNTVQVKKGDFIFIPAGTVHAIGGGLRLLEVQQCCNITYRLYDWGRPREIHIEKAVKSIKKQSQFLENVKADGKPFDLKNISSLGENFECDYFSLSKKSVKGGYSFINSSDEYELLFITQADGLKASYTVSGTKENAGPLKAEQIFAVAPKEKVTLEGHGLVIRIRPQAAVSAPCCRM